MNIGFLPSRIYEQCKKIIAMTRSKKIFIFLALLFFMALGYISYDISSRTTFPGSKPQLQERVKSQFKAPKPLIDSSGEDNKAIHR